MSSKIYTFKDKHREGKKIEKFIHKEFHPYFRQANGREKDLSLGKLNVEIKADFPDYDRLFIEEISNHNLMSPGGPWKAIENEIDLYMHFYVPEKMLYAFIPETLKTFVERKKELAYVGKEGSRLLRVPNEGYYTLGYAFKRKYLLPICIGTCDLKKNDKKQKKSFIEKIYKTAMNLKEYKNQ